jgi:hypothetical protein
VSGDVLDDSLEAGGTALEASDQPSEFAVLSLVFLHLLMDVGEHDLDGPDDSEQQGSEGNGSDMCEQSPSEGLADWASETVSAWGEVPDTGNCGEDELTNIVDEGNVPQQDEQVEIPSVSKKS